jgi:lysophospholipase L1-like esterase
VGAILCFGDSNTWGWHEDGRFARDVRWPGVLRSLLPVGWEVVEEGLGGRRASDALAYFDPCLHSHVPLDVVVVFLGVNDPDPATAAAGIGELVAHAREVGVPRVLVLAPPGFAAAFRPVCDELLDLDGRVAFRDDDPIHLDAAAHRALAHAVAEQLALGEPAELG